MFRKKGLEKSLAVFVLAIGLILFYSWNFAANIFYIGIALILLGIFSVFVLSDLLVTCSFYDFSWSCLYREYH